ncbi:MAG TPA: aminotransferase class I/II-fold pyridoxal phosphate-dependent enzyme [Spongiibacteraceae bacterium]|nr:aminotransferase class I/II-fold pyridoxal phosphate-dependent enzyme [Spongiibacteraceae bacterium]
MQLESASAAQLREWEATFAQEYAAFKAAGLNLDLTRGKPSADQLNLSNALDGILGGNYKDEDGTDVRNYGGLDGIASAKALFAPVLGVSTDEIIIGGSSSLTLMYQAVQFAHDHGVAGSDAWRKSGTVKFLAPVPGYDRHFTVCEHFGIELIPVAMDSDGPDMDQVEALLKADPQIKGIWCVPRFSNPSGIVYSDAVVERIAKLGAIAGPGFRVFWDNAYAVHTLSDDAPQLANIFTAAKKHGTEDSIYIFGSTSKITFAGDGVSFMAASPANLKVFKHHLGFGQIGPDKVNQLRHVKFIKDTQNLTALMQQHAALLRPRFDAVLTRLQALAELAEWTVPQGGYFISFNTRPGLAKTVVQLAAAAGVKLTPAGATFPGGLDPQDRNIRLAPSFPKVAEIAQATDVFVCCVKLASVRQALAKHAV